MNNPIEKATSYESAIKIIPERECQQGIFFLRRTLLDIIAKVGPVSLIWIERGGRRVGQALTHPGSNRILQPNPMRMSHVGDYNEYLPEAVCLCEPDYSQIVGCDGRVATPILVDNVVETKGSFIGATQAILNGLARYSNESPVNNPNPDFYYLALVSKIADSGLANLTAAFTVNEQVWVHGWDCDDDQKGRGKDAIWGRLKPNPDYIPQPPYYRRSF